MMHLRLASRTFARFASTTSVGGTPPQPTPAAAQLPKVAPHEGVPFSAPPVDVTKGELGQIHLPDMERIEFVQQEQVKIPGEPDNYSFRSLTPESETFPHFRPPTVFTVTSPSTHPGGAPTHGSTSDDVVIPAQEGDSTARAVPEAQDVSGEAEAPTTWTDRVLTGEERKGAYVLGGIVVGGFLLGGLLEGSKVEKKVQAVVKGTEEKVAEEKRLV